MQHKLFPFFVITLCICASCGCSDSGVTTRGVLVGNSQPPVLTEVKTIDDKTVKLIFDKNVEPFVDSFAPYVPVADKNEITIKFDSKLSAGTFVTLSGRVKDADGNTSGFSTKVWGYNNNLPDMLINEVVTKTECKTEILFTSAGNTAGAVLYDGIPDNSFNSVVFPDADVETGSFAVVWWLESVETPELGGENLWVQKDGVLHICAGTTTHPSSNNGIQTLAVSPAEGSDVVDCFVYSNKSTSYEGYGNAAVLARVKSAVEKDWWQSVQDPVLSTDSTKTRSMSRKLHSEDTNTSADWYITKNSGATFGKANESEEYVPQPKEN